LIASPDPNVATGIHCEPIKLEMVVRAYLTGHAWRVYKAGGRILCGEKLPDGMRENDKFPNPIITPATKAEQGHDEDISKSEILSRGILSEDDYSLLESYSFQLFKRGTEMAAKRGLILVDTKYEFGRKDGHIFLIDEIHTPDSSRYFYADGYESKQSRGEPQKQLSKEFVREWLISQGFQGRPGENMPDMPDKFVEEISERYIELFEVVTGSKFQDASGPNMMSRIERNITEFLKQYNK
jgi:phosphoribosylaminoimidazole-succinocarboxamide synthase